MTHREREGGAEGERMEGVERSTLGIETSRHKTPKRGKPAKRTTPSDDAQAQRNSSGEERKKVELRLRDLLGSPADDVWEQTISMIDVIIALEKTDANAAQEPRNSDPPSRDDFKRLERKIDEIKESTKTRKTITYADMVRAGTQGAQVPRAPLGSYASATKAIPSRLTKEIIVRAPDAPEPIVNRSPSETVDAIRRASGRDGAAAARRLPSGDVVVTFTREKEYHERFTDWVKVAFGEGATLVRRTIAVLAKGVSIQEARRGGEEIKKAIEAENRISIAKVTPKIPGPSARATRATLLIEVHEPADATRLCKAGTLWEARYYHTEPYCADLKPTQCFRCYEYGHRAKFCTKKARCGRCAGAAHAEGRQGEEQCPLKETPTSHKCINCKGAHPAWSRDCRAAQEARERSRQLYEMRPRQFAELDKAPVRLIPVQSTLDDYATPQAGTQKRKPGRPPGRTAGTARRLSTAQSSPRAQASLAQTPLRSSFMASQDSDDEDPFTEA
jgi:hypothetical protein